MSSNQAKPERAVVPCGSCRACCVNELLILHPEMGDDPAEYDCSRVINPLTGEPGFALNMRNGSCTYFGDNGCTIWDRAPALCREFDCRDLYKRRHKIVARFGAGVVNDLTPVMRAGKARLKAQKGRR